MEQKQPYTIRTDIHREPLTVIDIPAVVESCEHEPGYHDTSYHDTSYHDTRYHDNGVCHA